MNKDINVSIDSTVRYCIICHRIFNQGESWFNCPICLDYNVCEMCKTITQTSSHSHSLVRKFSLDYGIEKICTRPDMASRILSAIYFYSDRSCFGVRNFSNDNSTTSDTNFYIWQTFKVIGERIKNFSYGLERFIKARCHLAICAANRPEWLITDLACILQGIISVPIYCQLNDHDMTFIINHTNISVVVCDKHILQRLIRLHSKCSTVRHIICMDSISEINSEENGLSIHSMDEIEKFGSNNRKEYIINDPDDCITIVYTSGSSAFPKGAIISENVFRITFPQRTLSRNEQNVKFSYRPLAWITDRKATIAAFLEGGSTGFSTGDVTRLMEELALVAPTSFSAPPTFWNKIYSEFQRTLTLRNEKDEDSLLEYFSKLIPQRCRVISIGGAMVSPFVLNFMKRCFRHCKIVEAYGTTECGRITFNYKFLKTIIDYRLESAIDIGYTINDKPFPRGELVIKTAQMFSGYVNNSEETKLALTEDGYFRTGDIVELRLNDDKTPNIHIIDRRKNFFKLAQGQFVSAEFLESIYLQSLFVEQIYIYGDGLDNSVKAVIVPNKEYFESFLIKHNIKQIDFNHPDNLFYDTIMNDLHSIATKESLRMHEIPSKLIIDFEPFTSENGLLTLSMKLCRPKLFAHYAHRLKENNSIHNQLKNILEKAIGQELSLNDDDQLFLTTGIDSLTGLRLSHMIDNDLGVSIPLNILFEPNMNLQKLVNIVQDPMQICSWSESIKSQILNDCQLDLNIKIKTHKDINRSPSIIFITGTTGFVGAFLLSQMLKVYPLTCKFLCLVRCQTFINPLDRIRENMMFLQIWNDDFREQIIALRGDLTKYHFGFDDASYEDLANKTDIIIHCAAIVNFVLPYKALYDTNVNGTREIIRFAGHPSTFIPIKYISTMSLLPHGMKHDISIDNIRPDHLNNGYTQSKWVSETLMAKAAHMGIPVNIYRLGSIGSNTQTGACNKHDLNTLFISTIMKIGYYPLKIVKTKLNQLPVDLAAQAIISSDKIQSDTYGNIYYIVNKNEEIPFEDIVKCICKCGIKIESISDDEWKNQLMLQSKQNDFIKSIGEFFLYNSFKQANSNAQENESIKNSHLNFLSGDNYYIMKWLTFILNNIIH
ncbi:unnamed protein product [Rotaria sp. Silwood2]|nr:unnamed protein product [Rotaria sp. Silwood2]